ncbi:MAG: rhodanese-like domain-containing protein, partial [Candidatus Thiodiazotropha sp.]
MTKPKHHASRSVHRFSLEALLSLTDTPDMAFPPCDAALRKRLTRWFGLILFLISTPLTAMEALVDSNWLATNKLAKDLFLLDIQTPEQYRHAHIAGAVNAPYVLWRGRKNTDSAGMMPSISDLERMAGELGMDRNSVVVIIATGNQASDMAASSRVFWSLKVMGHRQLAILNGGLADYAKAHASDLEDTPRHGAPTRYAATPDKRIVASTADVSAALHDATQLLDARTLGEYTGVITLKAKERPGTIPGARHIPFDWFVDSQDRIRNKAMVSAIFQYADLNPDRDGTIHFCHTGHRAALSWFVDYAILGNRNAKLYDASMSEWALLKSNPMETRFDAQRYTAP